MLIYTIGLGTIFSVSKPGIMPEKIFGMQEDAFQAFQHRFWITERSMQSGICYEKMGIVDRMMMKVFVFMLKHKKESCPDKKHFAKIIAGSYDISSKDYIQPLVECMNRLFY